MRRPSGAPRCGKNGGQIPGYDIDPDNPGVPTVNETEKQLVRLIFETCLKDQGPEAHGRGDQPQGLSDQVLHLPPG